MTTSTTSLPMTPTTGRRRARTAARWLVTFTGFPLGGLTASLLVGPVDGPVPALLGGLVTGCVLGAVQTWGLGPVRPSAVRWIAATGLGLMLGLGIGAATVSYGTSTADLAVQGAICGLAVGLAQAVVLRRPRTLVLAWPVALAAVWALGWTVTAAIGVQVEDQFTVFGSSGAVLVAALTIPLPFVLRREVRS